MIFIPLLVLVALFFSPLTSELFEFNKIIVTYLFTILITTYYLWLSLKNSEFKFNKSKLTIPLIVFLLSNLISTLITIDTRTSIYGYYSRFNGGLLSIVSYTILFFLYSSYVTKKESIKIVKAVLLSALLVSIWGSLEHFGRSPSCLIIRGQLNNECWIQDVGLRVFATLGQPNWLGAWLGALIPISLSFSIKAKNKKEKIYFIFLSSFFFQTLLFTKSRSALIGFIVSIASFYTILFVRKNINKKTIKTVSASLSLFAIITIISGTPWTPSFASLLNKKTDEQSITTQQSQTVLETGGTHSGQIRKIVWKGAWDVFLSNPITGTGVETFAFAYYKKRPIEHNNTSEWNYLYNKAHNEYLNTLANTGAFGLLSYLLLITVTLYLLLKDKSVFAAALSASYFSLLITNFFGFSVVITNLLFFLIPAFLLVNKDKKTIKINLSQNTRNALIAVLFFVASILLLSLSRYYLADYYYARSQEYSDTETEIAVSLLDKSIKLTPHEALYHDEQAKNYTALALKTNDATKQTDYVESALKHLNVAQKYSPENIKLAKSQANILSDLSAFDETYLLLAIQTLEKLKTMAPTDATVFYLSSLNNAKLANTKKAMDDVKTAINLKNDYKRARLLEIALLLNEKNYKEADIKVKYLEENFPKPDDEINAMRKLLNESSQGL